MLFGVYFNKPRRNSGAFNVTDKTTQPFVVDNHHFFGKPKQIHPNKEYYYFLSPRMPWKRLKRERKQPT